MCKILLVLSSPRGEASHSTRVARELVGSLTANDPGADVMVRDLAAEPLPHLDGGLLAALGTEAAARTPQQAEAVAQSDGLVAELFAADTIVIASAMINFAPTSTLKTWFDHLLRAGVTFRYDESGPRGLVKGKKAYLVVAQGGVYSQGPAKPFDFQVPYLRHVLGFMGITDVEVIAIEGIAFGPEMAEKAVQAALERVSSMPALVAA
ncbi:FMN-dependent NADH-azoreductase [Pseudoxanthobacter sp. M-2]|uniref:FMN-dependent NADH-azoreductase n=1 Tax=Pseudoxanthobacter sp. M-2 TaxID=3078754 RepID=UPI0038FCC9DD